VEFSPTQEAPNGIDLEEQAASWGKARKTEEEEGHFLWHPSSGRKGDFKKRRSDFLYVA